MYEEKIINSFDSYEKASEEGVRLFGIDGNFLIYYLTENEPVNFVMEAIASESSLKKDWLMPEEDETWRNL